MQLGHGRKLTSGPLDLEVRQFSGPEFWPSAASLCGVRAVAEFPLLSSELLVEEEEDEEECSWLSLRSLPGGSLEDLGKA